MTPNTTPQPLTAEEIESLREIYNVPVDADIQYGSYGKLAIEKDVPRLLATIDQLQGQIMAAVDAACNANIRLNKWDEGRAEWVADTREESVNSARVYLSIITKSLNAHADILAAQQKATIDAQAATIAARDAEIERLREALEEFENHPCTATCERNRTGCIFCNAREALKGG